MGNGKIIYDDYEKLKEECNKVEGKVGIWGVIKTIHKGHLAVYTRIRALSTRSVGIQYQNWGTLIKEFTGCTEYEDGKKDRQLVKQLSEMNDITFVMSESIFDGRLGMNKMDLWSQILKELPNENLHPQLLKGKQSTMLRSHLRTAQAMLTLVDDYIKCDIIRVGCMRDGWRWELINWYNHKYHHKYYPVEPILDQYGNSYSGSREKVNKPILLSTFRNTGDVQKNVDEFGWQVQYFFKRDGFMYAGFEHKGKYFIEGIRNIKT